MSALDLRNDYAYVTCPCCIFIAVSPVKFKKCFGCLSLYIFECLFCRYVSMSLIKIKKTAVLPRQI